MVAPVINTTKGIFINGGDGNYAAGTADLVASQINNSAGRIGTGNFSGDSYYNGDIAEVIVFNRVLTLTERNNIQEYLGKKYSIKVTKST